MQRIRKVLSLILMVAVLLTGVCACGDREIVLTTAFESKELMRINNKSCYLPEMMLYLTTVQNRYEEVYGDKLWQQSKDGVSLESKVKDMVLAKVAQVKVMNLMAESYELTLTDAEKDEVNRTAEDFFASLSDEEIRLIGVTADDIVNIYSEYALANKVYDYVTRDINPEISDDEAREVTIQQIHIRTYTIDQTGKAVKLSERACNEAKEKAELVHQLLISEESSFESLAAKYNEADEETISFGREEINPIIEEAAFSLSKNQVSDVLQTEEGFYVIKCISDFDLDKTQLNKVAILDTKRQQVFDDTYNEFLTTITKTLNEKLYDSIIMIHNPSVTTTSFFDVDF